ncbi:MAG: BamA/TamA family outer membrane protein [Ekhidna sp.]|nr:BamA/TamA family outer membrane protein [Ekhidna sp.]
MRFILKHLSALPLIVIALHSGYSQDSTEWISIKKISIEGNKKTKAQIITRELSFDVGDSLLFSQFDSLFVWNKIRIYNTNLFNEVNLSLSHISEGQAAVLIEVDERWYLYPFPIFRLIDRNFNDWWVNRDRDLSRVNYGVRINQFNFRGRREFLRVVFQTGFTDVLNLRYNIPYIDKKQRNGLLFDLSYSEAKNVAFTTVDNVPRFTSDLDKDLRRVFRNIVRHSYRNSFYTFHYTTLGHFHVEIADTLAQLNPNYLGDERTIQQHFYFGHSFLYDRRNNVNYPTKGERLIAGVFKHGLGIYDEGVNYWRIRLAASKYWDLKKGFYAASDISILSTLPEDRNYYNYYKIGPLREVLRGYDLNIIEGSSYVIQRNEIKHKLIGRKWDISKVMPIRQFRIFPFTVYGKVYFDQGYAKGYPNYDGSGLLDDRYLYSYGAGLDLVLVNDLTFRLEYSRNALNQTFFFINLLSLL